ncbi:MAG TPA: GYF domain-containing protein [Stenotrophomonas sp.]|jgi:type IV pilus assembly protein PilA
MNEWYYAEGNRQRQGPLPPENLAELYRSGRIALDTLVWREGLPQWQPLSEVAAELGLPTPHATEPVNPAPPPLPRTGATPTAHPTAVMAAPKQGLSGCAIAAIVGAVVAVLGLFMLGILAAIALPAYQDYTLRAKVSAGYAQLVPLKPQVEAFHSAQGRCPVNGQDGFGTAESYAGGGLSQVRIGRFDNGHCGIEAVYIQPDHAPLNEKTLWLDLDPESGQWHCSSEIDDRYLRQECRG